MAPQRHPPADTPRPRWVRAPPTGRQHLAEPAGPRAGAAWRCSRRVPVIGNSPGGSVASSASASIPPLSAAFLASSPSWRRTVIWVLALSTPGQASGSKRTPSCLPLSTSTCHGDDLLVAPGGCGAGAGGEAVRDYEAILAYVLALLHEETGFSCRWSRSSCLAAAHPCYNQRRVPRGGPCRGA